jgi:hypothetical protein
MWINHDDYIEAVEKNSEPLNRIAGFQETIALQLKTIREGQDKLLQSQAALAEQVGYIEGLPSARNPLGKANVCDGLVALAERLADIQTHNVSFQNRTDLTHQRLAEFAERLANLEVAFTVRLEALENRLKRWEQSEFIVIDKPSRTNGKHPAGKRK